MSFNSEKEAAYWALLNLEPLLPSEPHDGKEWGMAIYRWSNPEGGFLYDFQWPPYSHTQDNSWLPAGVRPAGTEEVAYCHTHPNNKYFSTNDTKLARGELPVIVFSKKCTVYMVNQTGAYWYDGRDGYKSENQRKGLLWGTYPKKK